MLNAGRRLTAALLALALINPGAARAQSTGTQAAQTTPRPWFYEHSDVPMDLAWRFGVLPNGVRYAIRRNAIPERVVSIRVGIDAGSLMERPDEAGFAHFIEHLSFRGSRDVPDGESKRIWQRLGAEFGVDSNAATTPTQTRFAVDLPDAKEAGLDQSLKILASMVAAPNIVPAAVDAERAVVMAERREGLSPAATVGDQTRSFYFAGQLLGNHSPIGTEATLTGATAEKLQAFHDRWYRPDRTVIAISGDADPVMLESLVKKHFSAWAGKGPTPPLPDFGRPDPKAPATRVIVSPDTPSSISLVYLRPWIFRNDTIAFNQARAVDDIALQLINRRLAVAATNGASFLEASVQRDDTARSASATYVSIIPINGDWATALRDVRAIIEDARQTLPSKADIDREYEDFIGGLKQVVATAAVEGSARQADNLMGAIDIRETVVSPEAQLQIHVDGRRFMTPEQVRDSTRRMFTGDAVRALLTVKTPQSGAVARLSTALSTPVQPARNARLGMKTVTMASLPALPPAGKTVVVQPVGVFGIEQIVFENGVTLYLNPNKAEPGKVRLSVRFGHGQQSFAPDEKAALWAAPNALMAMGIGNLDRVALSELTNGRQLALQFGIDDDAFLMAAVSSPEDYKDQLRLYAAKLAFPRWDATPLTRAVAALNISYDPVPGSAGEALDRDIGWLLRDKEARVAPATPADAGQLTLARFREIWEPRLANGPIEVQLFGDVQRDEAVAAVAETFGALARRPETVTPSENLARRFPAPSPQPVLLRHNGSAEQAGAVMAWPTGGGTSKLRESRQLAVLARIINDRLFEKFRSIDGAAYTPSAFSVWPEAFPSGGYLMVQTQLKPERIPYFFSMMDEVVADLAARPVSNDELARQIEPLRQLFSRALYGNAFWMGQLQGLSRDPRRLAFARSMASDMLNVTPADIQSLARQYLKTETRWTAIALARTVAAPALPLQQIDAQPREHVAAAGRDRATAN